jgi:hypothetical protein
MFEAVSDWELIDMMGESTRYESMAIAERLAMVAQLYVRRAEPLAECEWWIADHCAAVVAEVAVVQHISQARAVSQVQFACALWHRLPAVAKVFLRGTIDYRVVSMIIARTENVDDEVIAELDVAIAAHAEKWMRLSKPKLRARIDMWVANFDPAAVRVAPRVDEQRYVEVIAGNAAGMALLSGSLRAEDGAALDARLAALADTVCEHDPRSQRQRRADACGPLARGEVSLACQCGREDCPVVVQRKTAAAAVIHVLAELGTVEGRSDKPGYLAGLGVMPAESVRAVAATATLKPVTVPAGAAVADGYRPSAKLTDFLRHRDLMCLWPGCDKPAAKSDIDHTVAWPSGPTHPSNLKHYCRTHHLIKTFLTGVGGWTDQQLADGTIVLTAPTGHVYECTPHGAALFPTLAQPTGELDLAVQPNTCDGDPLAKMPRRKQTREQERRDRINAERRERTELIAEEERQRQAWLAANYQPPPF